MKIIPIFYIWLVMLAAACLNGYVREAALTPLLGDVHARQTSVVSGSFLILLTAALLIKKLNASRASHLWAVGFSWAAMTLFFEFAAGRYLMEASWRTLASDYDVSQGGWMGFELLFLLFSPFIAVKIRGKSEVNSHEHPKPSN